MTLKSAFVLAAAMIAPFSAHAVTFDVIDSFNLASPVGVFSFGTGVTGTSFTPFTNPDSSCFGIAGIECFQTATPVLETPFAAVNRTGADVTFSTVVLLEEYLALHPGPDSVGQDAIVLFTAPFSASYTFTGEFAHLDVNPSGVELRFVFDGAFSSAILDGAGAVPPSTPGSSFAFGTTIFLDAGDIVAFGVNNLGFFGNDTTGLQLVVTTDDVPAPAALALFGLGLAGVAFGRRRRG